MASSAGASMPAAGDSARLAHPLVLVTTVEIGEGQTDKIELRLGDSPKARFWHPSQAGSLKPAVALTCWCPR